MMKNREGTVTAIVDTALVDASAHWPEKTMNTHITNLINHQLGSKDLFKVGSLKELHMAP
jgi:hypothetical protein